MDETSKTYLHETLQCVRYAGKLPILDTTDLISDVAMAYSAADSVISRAGAGSISEFCLLEKPVILVPSPNVAEDHQTKNALALDKKNAASNIKDSEAPEKLIETAIQAVNDTEKLNSLRQNISKLAFKDSANVIANEVCKLAIKYKNEHGY